MDNDELTIATGETSQPAPETGDMTQPAPGTDVPGQETPAPTGEAEQQPAPAGEPEKGPVPYDRFDEVNRERNEFKAKAEQYEQFIRQQQQQQPAQPQAPTQQDIMAQVGVTPDDLFTEDGLRRYTQGVMEMAQGRSVQMIQALRNEMAQMMNQSQTPDLAQVVGTVNPLTQQFQYGQPLQTYMNAHPTEAQAIAYMAQLPQTQTIVYRLITSDPVYQQQQQASQQSVQQSQQLSAVNQVRQINQRPANASELTQAGQLDQAAIRAAWTQEQVAAHVERAKAQAG